MVVKSRSWPYTLPFWVRYPTCSNSLDILSNEAIDYKLIAIGKNNHRYLPNDFKHASSSKVKLVL